MVAVEPVNGMRALLGRPRRAARAAGRAEALPLPDARSTGWCGQAFHWFASLAALGEFARVLRPHGRLGLIWNRRDLEQRQQAAIEQLIAPHRTRAPAHASDAWRAAFAPSAPFVPLTERRMTSVQRLDADGLVDRILSISSSPRWAGKTSAASRGRRARSPAA